MKTVSAVKRDAAVATKSLLKKDSVIKRFWKTRFLFILFVPTLLYYILFCYVPMWGITFSLYDYDLFLGLDGSPWVGLKHFQTFFLSPDFPLVTKNTLALGLQSLFISFPMTILFALLLNEIRNLKFKKVVQTVSYMPHFLSVVVICGLVKSLTDPVGGGINQIIELFGGEPVYFMIKKEWFRPIWLISELWATLGWGTIIYLAAISGVDPSLYEAAKLDGANRFRQIVSITLPAIAPTVTTMLILKVGAVLTGSMEKALLLGSSSTYEVSEILSLYIFNKGLTKNMEFSYSTAVGLYSNVVNMAMLLIANYTSKKVSETSIM